MAGPARSLPFGPRAHEPRQRRAPELLAIGGGDFSYEKATNATAADVTVEMDVATWTDIVAGRVSPPAAAIDGRITIAGDIMKALALDSLL